MKNKEKLFSEFETVSKKAWKQKIQVDLKGADYNESLLWQSPEGITVKPFYHSEDLNGIPQPKTAKNRNWKVAELVVMDGTDSLKYRLDKARKGGAESLVIRLNEKDNNTLQLLNDLADSKIETAVILDCNPEILEDYNRTLFTTNPHLHIYWDPIGNFAASGNWVQSQKEDLNQLEKVHREYKVAITVDSSIYQNAGAHSIQQLAYSMSHANEYLHFFEQNKLETNALEVTFLVTQGSNYFFEIAKLRALRILWQVLSEAYNINTECWIIAGPSIRNKTVYDYNINLLRSTTESMSAILGGADTVYNLPYDFLYHKSNDFAERIARNQLLILKEEGYLSSVENPADGSYYIESLTKEMSEKSLQLFKQLEKGGGFLKGLQSHQIQKKIKESDQAEKEALILGKTVLVGTNKYLNPEDKMKGQLEVDPFQKRRKRQTRIEPILPSRLAAKLEIKRLRDE